jgi:hypothetical protein
VKMTQDRRVTRSRGGPTEGTILRRVPHPFLARELRKEKGTADGQRFLGTGWTLNQPALVDPSMRRNVNCLLLLQTIA